MSRPDAVEVGGTYEYRCTPLVVDAISPDGATVQTHRQGRPDLTNIFPMRDFLYWTTRRIN